MKNRKHGTTRTTPRAGNVYEQCVECHAERLIEKDGQALKSAGKWSARWCVKLGEPEVKNFAATDVELTPKDLEFVAFRPLPSVADGPGNKHFTPELPERPSGETKLIDREYSFVHRPNCHCTTDDRPYVCGKCGESQVRRKDAHALDCLDCDIVVYNHKGGYDHPMPVEYRLSKENLDFCDHIAKERQALAEDKHADEGVSVGNKTVAHRLHMLGVSAKYTWHRLRGRQDDEIAVLLLEPFTKDGGGLTFGVDDILPGDQTLVVRGRTATKGAKTRLTMPIDKGRDITSEFVVLVEFTPRSSTVGVLGYTRRDMWVDWREAVDIKHGQPPKTTKTWVYRGPMLDIRDLLELCGVALPVKDLGAPYNRCAQKSDRNRD